MLKLQVEWNVKHPLPNSSRYMVGATYSFSNMEVAHLGLHIFFPMLMNYYYIYIK